MAGRYAAIWFSHLLTDCITLRNPRLQHQAFVLATPERGRQVITAASPAAEARGIRTGMVVADARAAEPALEVLEHQPEMAQERLQALGDWCIRFTPVAALDLPDGLLLDVSGCPHLWGGERAYLEEILKRLTRGGYHVKAAIADTPGAAWALSRYAATSTLVKPGKQAQALMPLPPAALRISTPLVQKLHKLGLTHTGSFMQLPRAALRRRFGQELLHMLDKALGLEMELLLPLQPPISWQERLPCPEPVNGAAAVSIAAGRLLQQLCARLAKAEAGIRCAVFKGYRSDGKVATLQINTFRPSHHAPHLLKLLQMKIPQFEPGPGIELFTLEAPETAPVFSAQEQLWGARNKQQQTHIAELLDRIAGKLGNDAIKRYLPAEHYWPERSIQPASHLGQQPQSPWPQQLQRPVRLLPQPIPIIVSAPVPDYPPMLFRYKGVVHNIVKADGPERIEQEWWLQEGEHRDYYCVEDNSGQRYWLFRSGHYTGQSLHQWYLHGYFS